ncbi:MAG: arsenosugar biosynthesis radical SAM protein ArsS [Deltaproteobacteria bacterium]|jgi:radical SAM/Cys-rich protein|nr:arsenosugar biosynthesis radical SAM protein ArsS [Deltaproteobacteria bacterium]
MPRDRTSGKDLNGHPKEPGGIAPFSATLSRHDLKLARKATRTLQVNLGFLCNQTCRHCHLNAGPDRKENMDLGIIREVISYALRGEFDIIDITGGAPELNSHLNTLIEGVHHDMPRIMLRSNLSLLNDGKRDHLMKYLSEKRLVIVASFPSLNEVQADSQRGDGIFEISVDALKKLNRLGYGHKDTGLELNLVCNPTGAFLPPDQAQTEKRFRQVLKRKWGIVFNNLYNFANVPLGRFRQWLVRTDNLDRYVKKLYSSFNACAVEGLMCRTLVSVSWDGYLYDCDFNLARGIFMGGRRIHVSEIPGPPEPGSHIATADHCYTCTAGAGFT